MKITYDYSIQNKYGVEEVSPEYKDLLIDEKHTIDEFGITSTIKLIVNITAPFTCKCEFSIEEMRHCMATEVVEFEGWFS